MKSVFLLVFLLLFSPNQMFAATAKAIIQGTQEGSELLGSTDFQDTDEGLRVQVNIFGAPPGLHGIHIHENGSCEDQGNAAGSHFNPDNAKHGSLTANGLQGAHAGDLGNIEINDSGEGALFLVAPGLTVKEGKYAVDGRAVILHEKQDDFGQPTGNAGGRIGCGIIKAEE